jgi:hypothetical protein
MNHEHQSENGTWLGPRRGVLIVFPGIIGFFLFTEHRAHLFGILPYLLLLACPFMQFMPGGRGGHGDGSGATPAFFPRLRRGTQVTQSI